MAKLSLVLALMMLTGVSAFSRAMPRAARAFTSSAPRMAAVGDAFPEVEVDFLFPPIKVNMADRLKGKKTIVVGLPGAFTPT